MSEIASSTKGRFSPWLIVLGIVGCSGMVITVLCNTAGMCHSPYSFTQQEKVLSFTSGYPCPLYFGIKRKIRK